MTLSDGMVSDERRQCGHGNRTVNLLLTFSCWSLVSESNKRIGLQENASNMRRATSLRADGNCVFARTIYGYGNWWRFLLFFIPGVFRVFPSVDKCIVTDVSLW